MLYNQGVQKPNFIQSTFIEALVVKSGVNPSSNPRLEIYTFGGLRLLRAGEPFAGLGSRKAEALLVYLTFTDRPQPREVLADFLWDEFSQSRAMNNLRVVLSNLRKHLGDHLTITRETAAVNPETNLWLDVTELETTLAAVREQESQSGELTQDAVEQLERAVALYLGEFLEGFYVRDARGFDEWFSVERERLHRLVLDGLGKLVAWNLAHSEFMTGIQFATRWLQLDPLSEAAHRGMMLLLAYSEQQAAALKQYEKCAQLLGGKLGLAPSEETTAVYEAIKEGQLTPPEVVSAIATLTPAPGEPPFKGLQYFDVEDADLFFGREELTAKIVDKLREQRFLAVVGASGSGKSSLVRAGLVSALMDEGPLADGTRPPSGSSRWLIHIITPTAHPLRALATSLTRETESVTATATLIDDLANDPRSLHLHVHKLHSQVGGDHLLLVVDQFEELFTLCRDEQERRAFVNNLLTAADNENDGPTIVVLTLRADFYAHCAQYEKLRNLLETHQVYIGQMNPGELQRTIEGPVDKGGWDFEPGLVELLLRDVGAHVDRQPEPGALPLLSHALLETWHRRRGHTLTYAGYADSGGVRGAIAKTAETVFNQELTSDQQTIARNIFLRLTELGVGTQDTRRRAMLEELIPRPEDRPAVEAVLNILANARLVTTEEGTAEVAHEALIREWPQLREWLDEDREGLRLHRQLTEAAQEWLSLDRDPGALYRGARLAQANEWVEGHTDELNPLEREFLDSSVEWVRREEAEREAQRQRELEAAKKLARAENRRAEEQAQSASQLRRRALFLTGALIIAGILAIVALSLSNFAFNQRDTAQQNAITATIAQGQALIQASTAIAAQDEAQTQAERADEAASIAQDQEATAIAEAARRAAIQATAEADARIAFSRELAAAALNDLDVDPERSILLALHGLSVAHTREAEEVLHQAVQASRVRLALPGHSAEIYRVAFSQDGERLATASSDGTAKVWDAVSGRELLTLLGHTDVVWDVEFDPRGPHIATSSSDGTAKVWDSTTGQELFTLSGHPEVYPVSFSSDGRRLATGGSDGIVKVWDTSTGQELLTLTGHTNWLADVAFSPSGALMATGGGDRTARMWDVESGQELYTLTGFTGPVSGVAFHPDGERLVTSSGDGTVKVWDVDSGQLLFTITENNPSFTRITFSLDGEHLAVGSINGTSVVWKISSERAEEVYTLTGHTGEIWGVTFSPDGKRLATAGTEGTARIWDVSSTAGQELLVVGEGSHTSFVRRVAISPDGKRLATAGTDGTAKVWDAVTGSELHSLSEHTGWVTDVAFNPAGTRIATSSSDGTAKVWDVISGQELLTLSGHGTGFVGGLPMGAIDLDFSPDGSRLATAGVDGTARVWDIHTGQNMLTLFSNTDAVTAVKFSSDGKHLATLNWNTGTAKVWDAETGQELLTLTGLPDIVWDLALSPDGKRLVTSGSGGIGIVSVWDITTGQALFDLSGHTNGVIGMTYSSDGSLIATAGLDGSARIWDASSGQTLLTLFSRTQAVSHVAFSQDGEFLATSNADGTARLYVLQIEDLFALARSRVTRSLTVEECRQYLHLDECPGE